jgi:polyhydroxyalkanoate synthesis regulator phasin
VAGDDLFKRYLEIGASVLGMTRERAEAIVRDLVASGEVARGQATKVADWLVERGKAGTEELTELVRREIRQQVTALGLATKDDVARLEAQIAELKAPAPAAKAPAAARPRKRAAAAPPAPPAGDPDPTKG